ncbi:amidohydrolase family protein [Marinimicrobium alkaliphilum]|uniref:amidohydrolase family protein n=1 Tax=Marinimicrobium alkaliphilum TaxID=2202654 RepID=UPI000DB99DA2|nr:amidohydrolase family protein [Marinimicrobium alkaliphilum]
MKHPHALTALILVSATMLLGACSPEQEEHPLVGTFEDAEIWAGASIWTGEPAGLRENAALVVRDGRVVFVYDLDERPLPEGIPYHDVSGKVIIPGLINAHGHVGMARGLETGAAVHSEDNVRDQLRLYAHYGITGVASLGDEPPEAFQVRDRQDPARPHYARLWLAGDVLNPDSPEAARAVVADAVHKNPDWLKIRVDDQLGRREAMPGEVYEAVIEASHDHDKPLASHMVTLEDAKGLMRAGTDLLAHSVRDRPVDQVLIDLMRERDICITPTLTREVSVFVYAERPDFFDDPFFLEAADEAVLEQLQREEVQARFRGSDADYYREALPLAKENMMRLHRAGVRVAMGTDSGPPARFQGYFEHLEMAMMVEAGMTPEEVLISATRNAAACMGLPEVGTLAPGQWADFVVLSANPLISIDNLREIDAVYLAGQAFESPYR